MGLDADALVAPKPLGQQPQLPNPTYAGSLKRAFLLRPDYIAAEYTVESDKEGLRFAKLARFPILSAAVEDQISRSFGPLTQSFQNQKTVGLNLAIPIYDQGQTNFNIAVAAATLDQAVAALNQSKLQVESDVRSALASLISARALLVQTNAELTAAIQSRRHHDHQRRDRRSQSFDGAVRSNQGAVRRANRAAELFVRNRRKRLAALRRSGPASAAQAFRMALSGRGALKRLGFEATGRTNTFA
jgi:hypothetical protein